MDSPAVLMDAVERKKEKEARGSISDIFSSLQKSINTPHKYSNTESNNTSFRSGVMDVVMSARAQLAGFQGFLCFFLSQIKCIN